MRSYVTRLSAKGQVVIPAAVRRQMYLAPGEQLRIEVGSAAERIIVLRGQTKSEIARLLKRGQQWLEASGVNLVETFHESRRQARARERRRRA